MRKITRTFRLVAITLVICSGATDIAAQTQKTIVFGSAPGSGSKSKHKHGHSDEWGKNTVTVSLLSYLDGFTALTYERMLTERFTISAGAGITYRNLWMQLGDRNAATNPGAVNGNHNGNRQDIEDHYGDFEYRKPVLGTYCSVSPKFYPRHESLDGSYIAPLIEYRNYRFDAQLADERPFPFLVWGEGDGSVPRTAGRIRESVRCLDISAVWGGHYQLRGHLVLSYHAGFGVRSLSATRHDLGAEIISQNTVRFTNDLVSYSDTRLIANLGISLGGWW